MGFGPLPPRVALILGILSVLGTASCTRTASGPIRIQLSSEPASMDPALAEDGTSLRVLGNTMDGLVGYDGAGKLQNLLAESYTVSPDGRRYVFKLRRDARWSDGKPVAAQDFVVGMLRALRPSTGSKLAGMLYPILGARAYSQGKASAKEVAIRDEDGHLVMDLDRAAPYFAQALSLPMALPERQDVLDAHHGSWPDQAPCTGPYQITRHQAERRISFEKNPYYWDPSAKIPPVDLLVVGDESTGLNLFKQGKLDILTKVPTPDLKRLRAQGVLHTDPFLATYYLSFNLHKSPFNTPLWRRAVSGAVRRGEVVSALDTNEVPARGLIPPGLEGSFSISDSAPDFASEVAAARAGRAQVGAVSAAFDTSQRNALVMEKVQHDLKAALGLEISLDNLDWKAFLKAVQTDPPQLFRLAILSPFLDPIQILQSFTSRDPNNYLHWSNAEYDRLVREISAENPGPARERKIRKAQLILVEEEAAIVPLFHYIQNHAVSARISGFRVNPFGVIHFKELGLHAK